MNIIEVSAGEALKHCSKLLWDNYGIQIEKVSNCDLLTLMNILATIQRARAHLEIGEIE